MNDEGMKGNDEARMTNDELMTKAEARKVRAENSFGTQEKESCAKSRKRSAFTT